ncbi:uncharacterized protein LOC115890475 [Sitophilus oryzae]|uniref:Uncharacterized protein LOC115890475 n=1 Tax=Sitophilus oryzae TaxID=7048 RepID=A0A6J2YUQ7_SITOR|nr:uncharacterized protein LOC115890475 [Sitophilus oryzae]
MHRDYCERRSASNQPSATYDYYSRIFNTKFNIGFFAPKKDQCDLCESFKNASEDEKKELENKYNEHLEEKNLSREEKEEDKIKAQAGSISLAIYDLQAVLPVPVGQSSAFFYKSRLNCYNFTVTEIVKGSTKAFFWHEVFGNRGAIEIGSCVLIYLEELSKSQPGLDIVFFSDNCMGQQKNRFLIAAYLYAVEHFQIGSITHKFLIRGHTQNEADAVHSIIEKKISLAKKSGPIYIPDQYVSIIREAKKKGKKIEVKEMAFEDFLDLKALADDMNLTIHKNTLGNDFKINEVKILRFVKGSQEFYYKKSYKQKEWLEVNFKQRRRSKKEMKDLNIKKAYNKRFELSENKKKDLLSLVKSNLIPAFYKNYYESILN